MKEVTKWRIFGIIAVATIVTLSAMQVSMGWENHNQIKYSGPNAAFNETLTIGAAQGLLSDYNNSSAYVGPMAELCNSTNVSTSQFVNFLDTNTTFPSSQVQAGIAPGTIAPFYEVYKYSQAIQIIYNASSVQNSTAKMDNITLLALNSALEYKAALLSLTGGIILSANATGQNISDLNLVHTLTTEVISDLIEINEIQYEILILQAQVMK